MGTINGIDIDLNKVSEASKTINDCNSELNTILTDLKKRVNDLTSTWKCSASDKLAENFIEVNQKFENCRNMINSYADHLNKTVVSYQENENKNSSNASAFD